MPRPRTLRELVSRASDNERLSGDGTHLSFGLAVARLAFRECRRREAKDRDGLIEAGRYRERRAAIGNCPKCGEPW